MTLSVASFAALLQSAVKEPGIISTAYREFHNYSMGNQLLAWSPSFYTDRSAVRERVLVMGTRQISFGFSNPSTATGSVQNIRGAKSSLEIVIDPAAATFGQKRYRIMDTWAKSDTHAALSDSLTKVTVSWCKRLPDQGLLIPMEDAR